MDEASLQQVDQQKNNLYRNEPHPFLLDQRELNELLNVNVQHLALSKASSKDGSNRKNSDEDVYVEETLIFTYNPSQADNLSPRKVNPGQISQLMQTATELRRRNLLIEVHKFDEGKFLNQEELLLRRMMSYDDTDAEIDKLLETFSMSGFNMMKISAGDFIENDIRLTEQIRDAIDEIKQLSRPASSKNQEMEKRKFLQKYMETAELLGVSLSVEHLLPGLLDIFKQDVNGNCEKGYIKLIYQNMEKLIDYLASSEITVGYNGIRDFITPFFQEFFLSENLDDQVKTEIQSTVIELLIKTTKIMTSEDRTEKVLPIILESIRDDSDEEKRILGLELVDRLAEDIGKEVCQNFLMYEIVSLQDDPIYRVRKETVIRMINISKVLGKEIFLGILFPVFKKLANDQIWGVRRAAVEVLPQISNLCPPEIKNGILIEMFKKFSQDSSKWVKMATFQYLGPFIASYEGIEPNPMLIDYYITICEQNRSSAPDNEVPYHCAYNFPAVLQTVGAKSWPKLQPVHDLLVKDSRFKVRRTLAFSLHEVAKIIGPDMTEKELIPVLYHFLKDVNEVREGVNQNLHKLLMVLNENQREAYVEKIAQTQIDKQDWRRRAALAHQIKAFSKIFRCETVSKFYLPIFFELCQDQVAEVRIEASKCTKNLASKLINKEEIFADFIQKVLLFKQSQKYNLRQTFLNMCGSLMLDREIFVKYFLRDFLDLQRDKTVNVRIVLSEVLAQHYKLFTPKEDEPERITMNLKYNYPVGGLVQEIKELRMMVKHLKMDVISVSDALEEVHVKLTEADHLEEQENKRKASMSSLISRSVQSLQEETQAETEARLEEESKSQIFIEDQEESKTEQSQNDTEVSIQSQQQESTAISEEKQISQEPENTSGVVPEATQPLDPIEPAASIDSQS